MVGLPYGKPGFAGISIEALTSILDTPTMTSILAMALKVRNRVKELRVGRGWTQQELADAVGVSRQSINSIERNRYVPSLELALAFARVFRCSTEDIFTLESRR